MFEEYDKQLQNAGIDEIRQTIDSTGMPEEVREIAVKELTVVFNEEHGSDGYINGLRYIGYLTALPWNRSIENSPDLSDVKRILDEGIKGPDNVKEQIFQYLIPKIKKHNIMVVDDEKIALKNIERALSKEGYNVTTANNGVEAIEKLQHTEFDVVITDLIMGDVDGHSVIKETKSRYPDAKVIMVTGYATVDTAVEAIRIGAFHYIEKPLKLDDVRAVVRDALREKFAALNETVLCLAGSSDTDKLAICKAIADAAGRQLVKISLSEIKDDSGLCGKKRADEEGAMPGRAIVELRRTGSDRPVIMLEGLDIIGQGSGSDLTSVLMEMIDPGKNRKFIDRYLNVPFDLSNIIFIGTANNIDNISAGVREILDVIEC